MAISEGAGEGVNIRTDLGSLEEAAADETGLEAFLYDSAILRAEALILPFEATTEAFNVSTLSTGLGTKNDFASLLVFDFFAETKIEFAESFLFMGFVGGCKVADLIITLGGDVRDLL